MQVSLATYSPLIFRRASLVLTGLALTLGAYASDKKVEPPVKAATKPDIEATTVSSPKAVGEKVREALGTSILPNKKLLVTVKGGKVDSNPPADASPAPAATPPLAVSAANRRINQARAAAVSGRVDGLPTSTSPLTTAMAAKTTVVHGAEAHWAYEGENGPQAWGSLKADFNLCAIGRRQSPISIEDGATLQGPAEPILFNYKPSAGTVVNNGHTIQVDVAGENSITVRGSTYRLLQFHFHTPSEEQVNFKRYPLVAHLVHKNSEGQLAVVAVLMDTGSDNALIEKVWTYMPLDAGDRVRMPADLLNVAELLPKDQRYYQFLGSLTTPPCSEGVLWMVLKTPMTLGKSQHKLFTQLYPNNARPVQALNGRPVRDAQ